MRSKTNEPGIMTLTSSQSVLPTDGPRCSDQEKYPSLSLLYLRISITENQEIFFLLPGNKYISQVYLTQNYINKFTQKKEPYLALIQWLLCDAIIPLEGLSPHLKWLKFKFLCLTPEHNFPIMWLSARAAFVNLMLHSSNNFLSDVFSLFTLSHIMSMNITLWFHSVISLFRKFQWLTNFW